ncbi:MAG: hypothetical protein ACKVYV_10905, partial [Limisphaerales bacterium]
GTATALRRPGVQPASPYGGTVVASARPSPASTTAGTALPRSTAAARAGLVPARLGTEARNGTPVMQAQSLNGDARAGYTGQRTTYPMLGRAGGTEARGANPVTSASPARDPRTGQPLAVASAARPPQTAGRPIVTTARPATAPRVQVEARATTPTALPQAALRPTISPPAARNTLSPAPVYSSRPEARSYSVPVRQPTPMTTPRPTISHPVSAPRPVVNAPVSAPRPVVTAPVQSARPMISAPAAAVPVARPSAASAPAAGASGRAFQPR